MTPNETLLTTGQCKYGHRMFSGGYRIVYSVANAFQLKGRSKVTQMQFIAMRFQLNVDWIMARKWHVSKSQNLAYHPATYSLEIQG